MKTIVWGIVLACATLASPLVADVAAAPPQIEVDFLMSPLLETLGLEDPESDLAVGIANELRDETIELLNREFPFLEWVPVPASGGDPIAWLTLTMRAEFGIGQRVFIDCSVRKRSGSITQLGIVARDVYPVGFNAPTPSAVETVTLANAKSSLLEMINGKSDEWQEKLTKKIPIGRRLVHLKPDDTFFVLPLRVSRLKADRESVLRVAFRAKVGDSLQQDGEIELKPLQQVHEPSNQFFGMQILEVGYYHYHPIEAERWHPQITEALANLVPTTTVRVFMKKYVPEDEDPIDDEF